MGFFKIHWTKTNFFKHIVFKPTRIYPPPAPWVEQGFVNIGVQNTNEHFLVFYIVQYNFIKAKTDTEGYSYGILTVSPGIEPGYIRLPQSKS
jgi:hypothetical protein